MLPLLGSLPSRTQELVKAIGSTPVVKVPIRGLTFFVKLEFTNPMGSHKDRAVAFMLAHAFREGLIRPGDTVVEASSGNTATSLAWLGRASGLEVVVFVPEGTSRTKLSLIRAFGGVVKELPNDADIEEAAREFAEEGGYFFLGQHENPANPRAHREWTGPEILNQAGCVDAFVMGIGTGGTIVGVGSLLKEVCGSAEVVGVVPEGSPVARGEGSRCSEPIEGLSCSRYPEILASNRSVVDEVVEVSAEEAFEGVKALIRAGIPAGPSTGAVIAAATKVGKERGWRRVVTLAADHISRYPWLLETPYLESFVSLWGQRTE